MPQVRAWVAGCAVLLVAMASGCGSEDDTSTTGGTAGTAATGTGGSSGGTGGSSGTMGTGGSSTGTMGTGGAGEGGAGQGGAGQGGAGQGGAGQGGAGGGGSALCQTAADCDDGVFCNGAEVCDPANGDPVTGCASSGPACDDGIACTTDSCDEAADSCGHAPMDALCNNGLSCDGTEYCNPLFGCFSQGGLNCNDGVACTSDFCDPATDSCAHAPDNTACSNGLFCDGAETCNPTQGCQPGAVVNCNDGIACTADSCDEAADQCAHVGNDAACSNGVFCDGAEVCDPTVGCMAAPPMNCDDNRSCTADYCSESQQGCVHLPDNTACDDGLFCNGLETCSVNGPTPTGCAMGQALNCADAVGCTTDACSEATQGCTHTPNSGACQAGQTCNPQQGCVAAQPCSDSAQCQDGNLCNGAEMCVSGYCQPGQPVSCGDGIACTTDICNPATGQCAHTPSNAACDDGLACNGVETCNAQQGCVSSPPLNCDDGISCTQDQCLEPGGTCEHIAQGFLCDDGNICNGQETCSPAMGCQPSAVPFTCPSDGIACTQEVCDPQLNACVSQPNNAMCPCGQTCNVQTGGCGNFCIVKECQGHVYACGDCIDNDGDCKIDDADDQCMGPCDNSEDSFYGNIPGQNNSPCKSDCYFDQDTGSGNDDCYWSHKCDPLEVGPNYPPEGSQCAYNPNSSIPGYGGSCGDAFVTQSQECFDYCGPLTPNGCDCFGCCEFPNLPYTVWLGSTNASGEGSCNLNTLNNPNLCKPCTQVQACLNTCAHCEVCIGKPDLPADCTVQECPPNTTACGQPGQAPCPDGFTCITGCCQVNPE